MAIFLYFTVSLIVLSVDVVNGYPHKRATGGLPDILQSFQGNASISSLLETQNRLLSQMLASLTTLTKGMHLTAGDCSDVAAQGPYVSGVYSITPWDDFGPRGAFQVYCDMETDGGGWTVIQKRFDGSQDFYRGWADYKNGFGDVSGEYWLGLANINRLTRTGSSWKLRIELEDFDNNTAYAEYDNFGIGDESTSFELALGAYSGTAGDGLTYHANMAFSTKDRDNDFAAGNCAASHKGGWWYKECLHSNLNGLYTGFPKATTTAMVWRHFTGGHEALKRSQMKIRPVNRD